MGNEATWREQQELNALYTLRQGDDGLGKLLESGPGNRIISVKQAKIISRLGMIAKQENWSWLSDFVADCVDLQLTIGSPVNSRTQYIDVSKFKQYAEHEKSRLISQIQGNSGTGK